MRTGRAMIAALLLVLGLFGAASFNSGPADAQVNPFSCPTGFFYVASIGGCVPVAGTTCPVGFAFLPAAGGCVPVSGVTTCPAGFALTTSGCLPPASSAAVVSTVSLSAGCNEVVLVGLLGSATPIATIVGMVQPAGIVSSAWQYNNAAHLYLALYFATPGAPTDTTTAAAFQSVFICTSSSGTVSSQAASSTQAAPVSGCPAGTLLTVIGCSPVTTAQGCLIGLAPTLAGCLPVGSGGCSAGFQLTSFGCLPVSSSFGCPAGFALVPTLGGCLPLQGTGACPIGFIANPLTGGCILIR